MADMDIIQGAYQLPSTYEINQRAEAMESLWRDFISSVGEDNLKYYIHKQNLYEIIKRQDQRMYYLKIFHGLSYPCEYKYIAIECFWINTLKPFMVVDEKSVIYDCPNERFALFLILSTIRAIYEVFNPGEHFRYPSQKRVEDILYDFKYCSLSREAMVSFVETYADTHGVGIEFILTKKEEIAKSIDDKRILALFGEYLRD